MDKKQLSRFGFSFKQASAHTSRTMMLEDLGALLAYTNSSEAGKGDCIIASKEDCIIASKVDYFKAINEDNCLGKRTAKTRVLSYGHLVALYSLDPDIPLFRALLYFWGKEAKGRPLLALLLTYARDTAFRSVIPSIIQLPEGAIVKRIFVEEIIDDLEPERFSEATLRSMAQNINSTLTKSGHLRGKSKKIRTIAESTPASVAYALFIGYLTGVRGQQLFQTEYISLLDCNYNKALELADIASRKGWLIFKQLGNIMEIHFPDLIGLEEMEKYGSS